MIDKEDVLRKTNFANFYRMYLPDLKPNGNKYAPYCLCPFHDDNNPSLSIYIQVRKHVKVFLTNLLCSFLFP